MTRPRPVSRPRLSRRRRLPMPRLPRRSRCCRCATSPSGSAPRTAGCRRSTGVSFDARAGELLAVVGESGCGKSVAAMALSGLLPRNARVTGSVRLDGAELVGRERQHAAIDAWQGHRLHLPGADDVAEPGLHRRPAGRRGAAGARGHVAPAGARPRRRAARPGRDPEPARAAQALSRTSSPAGCGSG